MRQRLLLTFLALAAACLAALTAGAGDAAAKSRYKLGMGDQSPFLFDNANFKKLKIKQVRVIIPWDWQHPDSFFDSTYGPWLQKAHAQKKQILVAFEAHRGCYENGRYSKRKICKAPSVKRYTRSFKAFRKQFPYVKQYQPWNEQNNKSQPIYNKPVAGAKYYIAMKSACRKCTVAAADILDTSSMVKYTKKLKRYVDRRAKGKRKYLRPRIWGLHNYGDVNYKRTRQTRQFLRTVPGQVWLTETGGLVRLLPKFKTSNKRAANRVKYLFKLANSLSKKRKGNKGRLTRVYPYAFFGYTVAAGQPNKRPRFDSGLVGPVFLDAAGNATAQSGKSRPAYKVFRKYARSKSK